MSVKDPGSRLLRWRIQLEEYDYEIVYKPGTQNANADALSRIGTIKREGGNLGEINSDLKAKILHENHDSVLGGHRGINKTYEAIKRHYQWPNMKGKVEEYVKRCTTFHLNKTLRPKGKAPMEVTTTAEHTFERLALDMYILTFQDDLHTSSHNKYSALVYDCLLLLTLYVLYKMYTCFKHMAHCIKVITDTNGSGNIVNIKIHTRYESLAMAQEDVPLRELDSQNPERHTSQIKSTAHIEILLLRPIKV
jgi:hypothetical protein